MTLTLSSSGQEAMAQTQATTKQNIQKTLSTKNNRNDAKTYVVTKEDIERQKIIDSLDITRSIKEINTNTDKLVNFYGKEGLSKKITQLIKEHPDFGKMTQRDKNDIVKKHFDDFFSKYMGNDEVILWAALIGLIAYFSITYVFDRFVVKEK